jgi:beta-lactamase superfamily II metal-dependent hydrolase
VTVGFGATAATLTILPPLATWLAKPDATSSELNDGSLGTEVVKGSFHMFLTGDGEVEANLRWRTMFPARASQLDVLKVGHHGANDAVFDNGFNGPSTWLDHTEPEVALVSANGTTHPRQNATSTLVGRPETRAFCTNVHGDIEIRVNEAGDYMVTVERNEGQSCTAGTHATTGPPR